ncbi:MAG: membrane protein of unknown function [Promethearchaeota archaeon]|nr:MAG: membrane protein of unknown function [Candidatus Lokiarchaeota archaeon]
METDKDDEPINTKFEQILKSKYTLVVSIILFGFAYIFQRFFSELDEAFIAVVLRNDLMRPVADPFWLIMFWPTVAIFFLSITVYFVFSNNRSTALAMLAIVVLGGLFLGDALKSVFDLPRPPQSFSDWVPAIYESFIPTTAETNDFPAQSVLVPAAFCTYFYLKNPSKKRGIFFIIYVILMFFARPYIGVNHISASIAGTIIGIYTGLIVYEYTGQVRVLSIFDSKIKKLLISLGFFLLMFIIYWLQRPLFHTRPAQGVDLDIRMFMIVLGGFLGLSITDYPKQLNFEVNEASNKLRFYGSILVCYIILFAIYFLTLILPEGLLWLGIIIGFIDGLWISIGGPRIVEMINKDIKL